MKIFNFITKIFESKLPQLSIERYMLYRYNIGVGDDLSELPRPRRRNFAQNLRKLHNLINTGQKVIRTVNGQKYELK